MVYYGCRIYYLYLQRHHPAPLDIRATSWQHLRSILKLRGVDDFLCDLTSNSGNLTGEEWE